MSGIKQHNMYHNRMCLFHRRIWCLVDFDWDEATTVPTDGKDAGKVNSPKVEEV